MLTSDMFSPNFVKSEKFRGCSMLTRESRAASRQASLTKESSDVSIDQPQCEEVAFASHNAQKALDEVAAMVRTGSVGSVQLQNMF